MSPQPMWNTGARDPVETFELDGKTWKRGEVGIAFHRPDPTPRLFRRKPAREGGDTWNSPRDAYSFGGELHLFSFEDRMLRLWRPQGVEDGAPEPGPDLVKELGPLEPRLKFLWFPFQPAGKEQILLFHFGEPSPTVRFQEIVGVTTWDLAANTLVDREARLADLFVDQDRQRLPRKSLPVR